MVNFTVRVESGAAQRILRMSDNSARTTSQLIGFCIERSLKDLEADVSARVPGSLLGVPGANRKAGK